MKTVKKLFTLMMMIAIALIAASCTYETIVIDPGQVGPDGNQVRIKFTLPMMGSQTRTVLAEAGENNVNDLTILFFEPSTGGTGKYLGAYKIPSSDLPTEEESGMTETNQFLVDVDMAAQDLDLNKADAYQILAMANMKGILFNTDSALDPLLAELEGMSETEAVNHMSLLVSGVGTSRADEKDNSKAISRSAIPMSASVRKELNKDVVNIDLTRIVSRFDVINNASGYRLVTASIWNAFTQTQIFDGGYTDYSYARTKRYYGLRNLDNGLNELKGGLYCFENVSSAPDQNDEKTTCLILGFLPNNDTNEDNIKFYRVNINAQDKGQYLKRNSVYQVTVSKVKAEGAGSEYDAYTDGSMLLDTSINSWDRDEDGLIIRNGENLLAIPTRRAVFSPEGEERQYYVYTLGTGTLELIKLDLPEGMDAWLGGSGNDLFIKCDPYQFDVRKGSIELRFAGMKGVIEIIQSGETEKYLTLSRTIVPTWPAGRAWVNMLENDPILVESSGSWTAEIYNDNFSFSSTDEFKTIYSAPGDGMITGIYSTSVNGNPRSRNSFVLVSLDDDPENYRNVIVITQAGTGGFTLSPDNSSVEFNPDMSLVASSNNTNIFTMNPGENTDTWKVSILAGQYSDKFAITYMNMNDEEMNVTSMTGNGKFRIEPTEINYNDNYVATVQIVHNELNTKNITVKQGNYDLKVSPTNITGIPAEGGTRTISVTSAASGLTYTATITGAQEAVTKGMVPNFGTDASGNPITTITQNVGVSFNIYMPGIYTHLKNQPTAKVEITVPGTTLTEEVNVTQNAVSYVALAAQTLRNGEYGTWAVSNEYFRAWATEIYKGSNFGNSTNSKVYVGASNISHTSSQTSHQTNARIININRPESASSSMPWATLRADPKVAFVLSDHEPRSQYTFGIPGFPRGTGGTGFNINNTDHTTSTSTARTIYQTDITKATQIWKWIFGGDGPWGEVTASEVALRPGDTSWGYINSWPDTFIPLIMDPANNSYCIVGIDPTHRLIWVGDTELFSYRNTSYPNFSDENSANMKFMRNLQAYLVHVANYGKPFNDRFAGDRSR